MRKAPFVVTLAFAPFALAQVQEQVPYLYFSDTLGILDPYSNEPSMLHTPASVMVKADLFSSPADGAACAQLTRAVIESQINSGITDPAHVCLVVFTFGDWRTDLSPADDAKASFLAPEDAVDVADTVGWFSNPPPTDAAMRVCQQPWMRNVNNSNAGGIYRCRLWMQQFLAEYNQLYYYDTNGVAQHLPTPARFHFDSEFDIIPAINDANGTRVMQAVALDGRWSSAAVPGANGLTMNDLFGAAKSYYGWSNLPLRYNQKLWMTS